MFGYSLKKDAKKEQINKESISVNSPIIQALGNVSPGFMDLRSRKAQSEAFSTVSEIYAPIMYMGAAFSNMIPRLYKVDKDGLKLNEIVSHDVLEKIKNPNPLNDWKTLLLNYFVNKKVFGNGYLFKYIPSGFKVTDGALWVLPSQYTYPVANSKGFTSGLRSTDKTDFIKGYSFISPTSPLQKIAWQPDEVMHQKEPNLKYSSNITDTVQNIIEGMSPLETLRDQISSIKKAYEAQNVILNKRGALGILSPKNAKDAIGAVTMTATDKKELQEQFQMYGLGSEQWQYILSNVELIWQPMSLPISELMLFEGIESSMIAICNTLNFPILLMNYLKGSTFSNLNESKKSLYQDNIIPEANSFMDAFNDFLGLQDQGLRLEADYSHIPVLQGDLKDEAEKDQKTVETIIAIQNQIFEGKITIDQGKAQLRIILGFSDEQIDSMLSTLTNNIQNGDSNIQQ